MALVDPELNKKRVISLLLAAAVILCLLLHRPPHKTVAVGNSAVEPDTVAGPVYVHPVISPYDSLFRAHSDTIFDWRLLAAIAFVESGFDTTLVSNRGAFGLMQVMPSTYKGMINRLGITDTDSINNYLNIYAAKQQLADMNSLFSFIGAEERINFILGSYNSGHGHILDAMRIARKQGVNRYVWSNIEQVFKTMSQEEVYTDSICRNGRFDGTETINFVRKVKRKYREYCQLDSIPVS